MRGRHVGCTGDGASERFGIGPVAVRAGRRVGAEEDKQDDRTDKRNQQDQVPPSRAVDVVQAANAYRQARKKGSEAENDAERAQAALEAKNLPVED